MTIEVKSYYEIVSQNRTGITVEQMSLDNPFLSYCTSITAPSPNIRMTHREMRENKFSRILEAFRMYYQYYVAERLKYVIRKASHEASTVLSGSSLWTPTWTVPLPSFPNRLNTVQSIVHISGKPTPRGRWRRNHARIKHTKNNRCSPVPTTMRQIDLLPTLSQDPKQTYQTKTSRQDHKKLNQATQAKLETYSSQIAQPRTSNTN